MKWHGEWQQEVHYQPGRGRTQHRGMQETPCRANATRLSAAGEQGWALAMHLATDKIRGNIIQSERCYNVTQLIIQVIFKGGKK